MHGRQETHIDMGSLFNLTLYRPPTAEEEQVHRLNKRRYHRMKGITSTVVRSGSRKYATSAVQYNAAQPTVVFPSHSSSAADFIFLVYRKRFRRLFGLERTHCMRRYKLIHQLSLLTLVFGKIEQRRQWSCPVG